MDRVARLKFSMRKPENLYHCDSCGEPIAIGETYYRWRLYDGGEACTNKMHTECYDMHAKDMKKQKHKPIWVVEILEAKEWIAFSNYTHSRYTILKLLKKWEIAAPKRKFRHRKYLPQEY